MAQSPKGVTVYSYHVGFGDCFLLEFQYSAGNKYVLIDFGSTGFPDGTPKTRMMDIANDIAKRCKGKLEAVVATHRHADHISGFTTNAAHNGTGDVIRKLAPKVVIQPWTESPDLAKNAVGPKDSPELAMRKGFASGLRFSQRLSRELLTVTQTGSARSWPKGLRDQLAFIGESNLANLSAVKNLMTMGKKPVYTFHGGDAGLGTLLPGVKVQVLGPPTLRQTETIRKQKSSDKNEFWQLHARRLTEDTRLASAAAPDLFPKFPSEPGTRLRFSARWLANRIKSARGEQLLQLVRILDQQMNNTSVILLIQVAGKKLLFPGDAQIENWAFALSQPKTRALLAGVDLYKVGHHGSRNATPHSMWDLFDKRGPVKKKGRLRSVLSTMPGKHGSEKAKTEVPRLTLLHELTTDSELHNTDTLAPDQLCHTVTI